MKLQDYPLLTDENIDPELVAFLRARGFDVLDVAESGLHGSTDAALLRLAHGQRRVVVTHDADFGTLALRQREPLVGIVYLRPAHFSSTFTEGTLLAILDSDLDLKPPFVLVGKRSGNRVKLRVRHLEEAEGA